MGKEEDNEIDDELESDEITLEVDDELDIDDEPTIVDKFVDGDMDGVKADIHAVVVNKVADIINNLGKEEEES